MSSTVGSRLCGYVTGRFPQPGWWVLRSFLSHPWSRRLVEGRLTLVEPVHFLVLPALPQLCQGVEEGSLL